MAIISANDLNFITDKEMLQRLKNCIETIEKLEKWNGHLYNWYDITTLKPLEPRFISTVDSGNFVGYMYVVKNVFNEHGEEELEERAQKIIDETNFKVLYDYRKNLFSIGYDATNKKLIDSYYDLLASEARLASFVAIAKRDIFYKHWFYLGRSLTTVDGYKGLVSWAGTMFEYFMPFVIMKSYDYTLLEETYRFCIYSQKRYAKKLNIPWGISESAYNLQDLNYNYQYKAFGIPWLGLKRGLKDEIVVAPYASILALSNTPKDVIKNIENFKKIKAYDKYGLYESIDYTPSRVRENYEIVKTYMAHHQGLILLSINNYLNKDILKQRFSSEPCIKATQILLQERVPQKVVFTKEKKEKVKVLKYKDYEDSFEKVINKPERNVNILAGDNYMLLINDKGEGYSKTNEIQINKYKENNKISNLVFIKDRESKKAWSNFLKPFDKEKEEYRVSFTASYCEFYKKENEIETTTKIAVSAEDRVELRQIKIKNTGSETKNIDVISYLEVVMAEPNSDIVHPVYNSLFIVANNLEENVVLEKRFHNGNKMYLLNFAKIPSKPEEKFEIELDKTKIIGRGKNLENAEILEKDKMYSNEIISNANTAISLKKYIEINPNEEVIIDYYIAIGESIEEIKELKEKYTKFNADTRLFELAKGRSVIENRFLNLKGTQVEMYNKILSEVINGSKTIEKYEDNTKQNRLKQSDLWKFGISGDLPIILVKINDINDSYVIEQLVKMQDYFFYKKIKIDLVILNEEANSYEQYLNEKIFEIMGKENTNYLFNQNGGIHILKKYTITKEEINLIYSYSNVIIEASKGIQI